MKKINGLSATIFQWNKNSLRYGSINWLNHGIYLLVFFLYFNLNANSQTVKPIKMDTIRIGSSVPSFSLKDQNGQVFDINSVIGKMNLVIYFYPKDDSAVCTKEACSFRDQYDVFKNDNAMIIGISGQSVESHLAFANKNHLNFTLLSDEGNKVRKLFGVPSGILGIPGRVTYIVNKEGKVVFVFNSQLNGEKHVREALRILAELK